MLENAFIIMSTYVNGEMWFCLGFVYKYLCLVKMNWSSVPHSQVAVGLIYLGDQFCPPHPILCLFNGWIFINFITELDNVFIFSHGIYDNTDKK